MATLFDKYDLALFQRALNRCYNVRFKFLNVNAVKHLMSLLKAEKISYEANDLRLFLDNFFQKKEKNNYWLHEPITFANFYKGKKAGFSSFDKFLCPQIEDKDDNIEILKAIYNVIPEGSDPVFSELRLQFPVIKLYVRYYYLALISWYAKITQSSPNETGLHIFRNPIGYYESIIFDINKTVGETLDFFPIVSNMWLDEEVTDYSGFEKNVRNLINTTEQECKRNLDRQTWQYLLSQLLAYLPLNIFSLRMIQKNLLNSIKLISDICTNNEEIYKQLNTFQKVKLFEIIPFLISLKVKKLIQGYSYDVLKDGYSAPSQKEERKDFGSWFSNNKKEKKPENKKLKSFVFEIGISDVANDTLSVLLTLRKDKEYDLLSIGELKVDKDFSMALARSEEKLRIETNLNEFDTDGFKEKINYYYYKSNRDMITKINAAGRVFFNILRYELEKVELQNVVKQYSLITKFALQKLLADEIYFISYNSFEESIKIEWCKCNSMLNNDTAIEKKIKGKEYVNSGNPIMQKIFECIHSNEIITKNEIDGDLDMGNCFVLPDYSPEKNRKKTFNDILLVPVISHNRKIGVLMALSSGKHHFNKIDRLLMADFVYNAGIEIFESKLFRAIQNINQTRENIYDNITKEVLELFNTKEVVLLQNDRDGNTKKVLSYRGKEHTHIFQKNAQIPLIDLNKVTELKEDVHSFSLKPNLGISIPLKDRRGGIYAYIILYDDNDDGFSKSLYRECSLLSQEISHVILDTELSNKQKQIMKSLIAHDVSSSLRGIDGARKNILHFHQIIKDFLTVEVTDDKLENALNKFRLATKDVERFTGVGKHLIDYFTENLIDGLESQIDDWQTFGIRKYTDIYKNKMDESRKADLSQIINQVLNSLSADFKEKNIWFNPPTGYWPGKLWIDSNLAKQIIDNMVSNALKYSLPGTVFRVKMEMSITGYRLIMENEGASLTLFQESEIDTIFENEVRFSDSSEGKGIGLFFAKNILLQHGGDITVNYKKINENRGLFTFTLIFPFQLELKINPFK